MATIVEYICDTMNMSERELTEFLARGSENYAAHVLKTKSKKRTVFQPCDILKKMQRLAIQEVFSKYDVLPCSTAYEKGCSVLKNARVHQRSKYLARFDIKDFFGSIKYWHFEVLLEKYFATHEIKLLWNICSLNNGLPVGAYSSSFVANRIMFAFDSRISKLFKSIKYTRYADDMIFSSNSPLPINLEQDLIGELREYRFYINEKKSHFFNEKTPKRVTGVTITPQNKLTVGKRYKLAVKKQLYDYITKKKGNRKKILGRLEYIRFIEKPYYEKLVAKYKLHDNLLKHKKRSKTKDLAYLQKDRIAMQREREGYSQSPQKDARRNESGDKTQRKDIKGWLKKHSSIVGFLIAIFIFIIFFTIAFIFAEDPDNTDNGTEEKKIEVKQAVIYEPYSQIDSLEY